jgi:hypothetical protein
VTDETKQVVRRHLSEVVGSVPFRRSPRCREFLQYVVEQAVEGRVELLKERSIGLALFGRKADYETAEDSIVRVRANEVRKRLARYYEQASGSAVQFDISVGSYVPQITVRETAADDLTEPSLAPRLVRQVQTRARILGLAVIGLVGLAFWLARPSPTPVDEFWRLVVNSSQPALLWSPAGESQRLPARVLRELDRAEGSPVQVRLEAKEVERIESQISSGTLHSILSISELLQRMGRAPQYRVGGEITLQEMGSRPLVLIGAFSNPWVMQLNSGWRYQFVHGGRPSIRDTQTQGREWALPASETQTGFDATVDYALVTRVYRQDTSQVLIAAGGLKHFGTGAAGEFVTNPAYWREAAAQLPKDWSKRNLQVVLETRVIRKAAGPPKVLAVHCW